ncbi:MAG TPA: hypothetical protein PKJ79_17015, partial [Quisquiliibacterium sp.]|nr:hypothetical protein [Quisquiliibacterium sp.]
DQAANSWQTVGIIGIVSALWAGANWIGNLKSAVRAQVRDDFAAGEQKKALPLEVLINIAIMLGVLLAVLVTFASSSVATSLGGFLLDVSGLRDVPGSSLLVSVLPVVASLIAQGHPTVDALRLGVWLHGHAGDLWQAHHGGTTGMSAAELPHWLVAASAC